MLTVLAYDWDASTMHDQMLFGAVYAYDDQSTTLNYSASSCPANGTVTLNSDGSFAYTPNSAFVGTDSFTFLVTNGTESDTGQVTIQVYNTAPEAYNASESVLHDQTLYSSIYSMDIDGDPVTYSVDSGPASGTLSLNADGSYTYTPNANFAGSDSFDYSASDGIASATATIEINVYNSAPEAYDSSESVVHDQVLYSSVYAMDMDGDTLTYSVSAGPTNGTLALNPDGSYTYTPNANFAGSDSFDFSASDGIGIDTATVSISVHNSAPHASNMFESVLHDQVLFASVDGSDADGDTVSFSLASPPTNGTVSVNSDGSYAYMPNANFVGSDTFSYSASDGIALAFATVSISVYNTEPVAVDDSFAVILNQKFIAAVPGVLGNDTDADGDSLTVSLVTGPTSAAVFTLNPDGSFEYEPNPGFIGDDRFVYSVSDGLATSQAIVSLAVDGDYVIDIKVAAFIPLSKGGAYLGILRLDSRTNRLTGRLSPFNGHLVRSIGISRRIIAKTPVLTERRDWPASAA